MAEVVLTGFDLSQWQSGAYSGGGGFAFGIAKATEGVGFQDPAWSRHIAAILLQPIVPGAYHFSRPDLNPGTSGAYAEADWFWSVASTVGGARGMLLANDAESAGGSLQWCQDFAGRLAWRAGGYNALFYSYLNWMQTRGIVGSALLAQDPLWLAWPDAGPLPFACSMQQYGLTSVPGVKGSVDANRFFGSVAQLKALTVGGTAPATPLTGGSSAMSTIAIAPRPDGSGLDRFAVTADGTGVSWNEFAPDYKPGAETLLPTLGAGVQLRGVVGCWISTTRLVVRVQDAVGAEHQNALDISSGWANAAWGAWQAMPGTWLVPAALSDVSSQPAPDTSQFVTHVQLKALLAQASSGA